MIEVGRDINILVPWSDGVTELGIPFSPISVEAIDCLLICNPVGPPVSKIAR